MEVFSQILDRSIHFYKRAPIGSQLKPYRPALFLCVLSLIMQTIYLVALPISFEGDAGGYYAYARYLAKLDHNWFMWWRPPGYPAYLHFLGMTWLDSFNGVLAANAVLGISMPLLIYGTLYPVGKRWAFVAALIFIVSTDAYSYAKVFITEHPYSFFLLLTAFALSRFIVTLRWVYGAVAIGAILVAIMMRNEALFVAFVLVGVGLSVACKQRNRAAVLSIILSTILAGSAILGWSWVRSYKLGKPELFGSLHNFTGRQVFWRVYFTLGPIAPWFPFSLPKDDENERWTPDKRVLFISAKNGPASAELAQMFPEALLNPTDEWSWKMGEEVNSKKGILETDRFFKAVLAEAIATHPEILGLLAITSTQYLGVYIPSLPMNGLPIFNWWTSDRYEVMPFNIGNAAKYWLTPDLFSAYSRSQWQIEDIATSYSRPVWDQPGRPQLLNLIHHGGQLAHNIVRNTLGVVLLVTVWFLPFTRHRALAIFLFFSTGVVLASGAVGFGFNGRYEHFIIPLLLMIAVLSVQACVNLFLRRRLALGSRPDGRFRSETK